MFSLLLWRNRLPYFNFSLKLPLKPHFQFHWKIVMVVFFFSNNLSTLTGRVLICHKGDFCGDYRQIIGLIYPVACPPRSLCRAQLRSEQCPLLPFGRTLPVGDTAGEGLPHLSVSGPQWSASPRCQSCSCSYGNTENRANRCACQYSVRGGLHLFLWKLLIDALHKHFQC